MSSRSSINLEIICKHIFHCYGDGYVDEVIEGEGGEESYLEDLVTCRRQVTSKSRLWTQLCEWNATVNGTPHH